MRRIAAPKSRKLVRQVASPSEAQELVARGLARRGAMAELGADPLELVVEVGAIGTQWAQ